MIPRKENNRFLGSIERQAQPHWQYAADPKRLEGLDSLQDGTEIHVWRANAHQFQPSNLEGRLSEYEREQARRFRSEQDRMRYMTAHALLRELLSVYAGLPEARIQIQQGRYGKPFLPDSPSAGNLRFNLSHSGETVVCAFSRGVEVGIDVESIRQPIDFPLIVRQRFSEAEQSWMASFPADKQLEAFYYLWTRKEALLKTLGTGLYGIDDIKENDSFFDQGNTLLSFRFEAHYQCSMSVGRTIDRVRYFYL